MISEQAVSGIISKSHQNIGNFDNIPHELQKMPRWVMWKLEPGTDGRITKIPFSAKGTGKASSKNPDTWSDFNFCWKLYEMEPGVFTGIGFVLSSTDDIICIDLDDKTGLEKLSEYTDLALSFNSYAEVSQSGKGVHIFCRGKKPGDRCRREDVEIYDSSRYIAITGNQIPGTPGTVNLAQEQITKLYNEEIKKDTSPKGPGNAGSFIDELSDDEIIKLASKNNTNFLALFRGSTSGYDSPSEADGALTSILAFYSVDPFQIDRIFRRSGLYREKWEREDYRTRTISSAIENQGGKHYTGKKSRESPVNASSQYESDAQRIIQSGTVLEHFRSTFKTLHSGNIEMCDVITLAAACGSNLTSSGIQPGFSGQAGTGKTSGVRASLHLWPEEFIVDGGLSNKALFYDESLRPGCVVFSDDTYLNEELLQTIKASMSAFQKGAAYRTVGKGPNGINAGIKKHIPPRSTFIFTSIDDTGDQELSDRQYKISLSPDIEQKKQRLEFLQELMEEGREELPLSPDVQICRDILRDIKSKLFKVRIPFAKKLHFSDIDNMRDVVQFFDFIQAVAILNYPKRNPVEIDGIIIISATESDYRTALSIFKTSDDVRKYKITKNERALIDWLCDQNPQTGMPESTIVSEFGKKHNITRGTTRRLLYGRDGNGGLCNRVPGIYLQKERISNQTNSDSKIQANVIYCNPDLKTNLGDFQPFVTLVTEDKPSREDPDKNNDDLPGPDQQPVIQPIKEEPTKEGQDHKQRSDTLPGESLQDWKTRYKVPNVPAPSEYKDYIKNPSVHRCICAGCNDIPLKTASGNYPLCQHHLREYQALYERKKEAG